jgi:acetolactate synthase-1/2/3 large subunit
MDINGGDIVAKFLKTQGVQFIFTLCGGHIAPILVGCHKSGIRVIDVRDEANAVFAADATARLTGVPGIATVTAGPGLTNTITAVQNAAMAQSPVIILSGGTATVLKNKGALQDIDQLEMMRPLVKQVFRVIRQSHLLPMLGKAWHAACSGIPGPVYIECPIDLLYNESLVRQWYGATAGKSGTSNLKTRLIRWYLERHVNRLFKGDTNDHEIKPYRSFQTEPPVKKARRAATMIAAARKPVLIAGSQVVQRPDRIPALVEAVKQIGIPVFLTGMARGLLGNGHPQQMIHSRKTALAESDLVILAGMPCDFRLNYGRAISSNAQLISVNLSRGDLHLNRKADLSVLTEPSTFLCDVSRHLKTTDTLIQNWRRDLQHLENKRRLEITTMATEETDFINPLRFLQKLEEMLPEDSIIVADGGDFVASAAYILRPRSPLSWLDPGVFGTLGVGAGFALAAKLNRPDKQVWLIYGDGAAGFSLQEFDTFVRHKIPVIAVVGNDAGWTQIARDQKVFLKNDIGTVLQRTDYHKVAEGFGAKGLLLEKEDDIEDKIDAARNAAFEGTPVLLNVLIGSTDFRKGSISM